MFGLVEWRIGSTHDFNARGLHVGLDSNPDPIGIFGNSHLSSFRQQHKRQTRSLSCDVLLKEIIL
jgi:hypothetical protein